jgi:hypothetical protein
MLRRFLLCLPLAACLGAAGCHGGCGGGHVACEAAATGLCWVGANMAYREQNPGWTPQGDLPVVGDDRQPEPTPACEHGPVVGH